MREKTRLCTWGHAGDSPSSNHNDSALEYWRIKKENGLGGCKVISCDCLQFTERASRENEYCANDIADTILANIKGGK